MPHMDHELNGHPDLEKLRCFSQGRLPANEAVEMEEHLSVCDACCSLLEAMPNDSFVGRLCEAQELVSPDAHLETIGFRENAAEKDIKDLPNHPRFTVIQVVGRGGMGVVIRCRDVVLSRDLALKILHEKYHDNPGLVSRFMEEARITGQLQHPYIVPIHELGTLEDGRPYFAMKLVQGRTLADLLRERPTLEHDQSRFLTIFEQICQAIAYAHSKGVFTAI